MATNYYSEGIERITEQSLEQELLNDIVDIKNDAIRYIKNAHANDASKKIIEIRDSITDNTKSEGEISGQGKKIRDDYLAYSAEQKRDMVQKLADTGVRKTLTEYDNATTKTYNDTVAIAQNTENSIEDNIRIMIVEKGYKVITSKDNNGNVTATLVRGDN